MSLSLLPPFHYTYLAGDSTLLCYLVFSVPFVAIATVTRPLLWLAPMATASCCVSYAWHLRVTSPPPHPGPRHLCPYKRKARGLHVPPTTCLCWSFCCCRSQELLVHPVFKKMGLLPFLHISSNIKLQLGWVIGDPWLHARRGHPFQEREMPGVSPGSESCKAQAATGTKGASGRWEEDQGHIPTIHLKLFNTL